MTLRERSSTGGEQSSSHASEPTRSRSCLSSAKRSRRSSGTASRRRHALLPRRWSRSHCDIPTTRSGRSHSDFSSRAFSTRFETDLRLALETAPAWPWKELAFACLDHDFVRAADMWAEGGSPTWEARLRVRAAEELIESGRRTEAEEQAEKARAFYETVGATYWLERLDTLVREAEAV